PATRHLHNATNQTDNPEAAKRLKDLERGSPIRCKDLRERSREPEPVALGLGEKLLQLMQIPAT
ncbi:hypothetical protein, partial [Roseospira navarrensis]|uniref:hypothetical protein n=1 Tax=Roseospira navarrensis TaxID=140058 RepID=UPI001B87CF9C